MRRNQGVLDTRVYENTLKTYARRLGAVQEELVYLETRKMLRRGNLKRLDLGDGKE